MLLPVTVLVGVFSTCLGLDQNGLYPYGAAAGDMTLTPADEHKVLVDLPDNFIYFRRSYRRAYVRKEYRHQSIVTVSSAGRYQWIMQLESGI